MVLPVSPITPDTRSGVIESRPTLAEAGIDQNLAHRARPTPAAYAFHPGPQRMQPAENCAIPCRA